MIEIRKMTEKDLDDVSQLEQEIFSTPWSRESFCKAINDTNNIYLVARDDEDGKLAGYCGIWMVAGEGQINNVAVNSEMRNRKIAYKMLKIAMQNAKIQKCNDFTLEVRKSNEAAIGLYLKLGFENCGERKDYYSKPTENAIIMWKYGNKK